MLFRLSSGEVEEGIGTPSLHFRAEIQAGDIHLRIMNV